LSPSGELATVNERVIGIQIAVSGGVY
jgi:hypothetical protein